MKLRIKVNLQNEKQKTKCVEISGRLEKNLDELKFIHCPLDEGPARGVSSMRGRVSLGFPFCYTVNTPLQLKILAERPAKISNQTLFRLFFSSDKLFHRVLCRGVLTSGGAQFTFVTTW